MKRMIALASVALIVAVGLGAPASAASIDTAKAPSAAEKKKAAYLADLHRRIPITRKIPDAVAFGAGKAVCLTLDDGGNFEDIFDQMDSANIDVKQAVAITFSAVGYLCPGHRQFLINYADSLR